MILEVTPDNLERTFQAHQKEKKRSQTGDEYKPCQTDDKNQFGAREIEWELLMGLILWGPSYCG